jgi:hypothetical protein
MAAEFLSLPSLMFNCPEGRNTCGKYVLNMRIVFHISLTFVFETCFAPLSIYLVAFEMRLEKLVDLHTTCPLLISNCNKKSICVDIC